MSTNATRRDVLRAGAGLGVAAAGLGTAQRARASEHLGAWLSDVENFDGTVVDATGQSEATVEVGVEANGGAFGFGPPAVRVDPGTTMTFEWTGEGGSHNVVAEAGADFGSELTDEEGFTFEYTVESEGVIKYVCDPHASLGMKGALVVGDVEVDTSPPETEGGTATATPGGQEGGDDGGSGGQRMTLQEALLSAVAISPLGVALFLGFRELAGKD